MQDRSKKNAGAPRRPEPFPKQGRRLPAPPRRDDLGQAVRREDAEFSGDILSAKSVPLQKGRRVLLAVLPIVAVFLMGLLVFLILIMPKRPSKTQLRRLEASTVGTVMPRPSTVASASVTAAVINQKSTAGKALPPASAALSRRRVSEVLRIGVGLPPGRQQLPQVKSPAAAGAVWQPAETVPRPPAAAELPPETTGSTAPESSQLPSLSVPESSLESSAETTPESLPAASVSGTETSGAEAGFVPSATSASESTSETLPSESESQAPAASGETRTAPGFIPVNVPAYVYGDIVNVRQSNDLNAEILTVVNAGDVVQELETDGSWSKVQLQDGSIGYIFSNLLSYNYVPPETPSMDPSAPAVQEEEFQPYDGTLYSNFSGLNIRSGPSTDSEVIGTMYYGDNCHAVGYNAGWFKIVWYDGKYAYVHGDYLQTDPINAAEISEDLQHVDPGYIAADPAPNANLAGGAQVANLAQQYVGYPYVFGAAGPDAFDCSGFAMFIYQQMGIQLSRTTYDQVNNGIAVPFGYKDYSNLVPGDLLLFATGGGIGHVGIYIGGGQMVHAGTAATGVIYDDLNMDYWASRLAYVRRILY